MKKTKKKPKVPAKYLAGLSAEEKKKRKKEIARNKKKAMDDPSAYKFSRKKVSVGKRLSLNILAGLKRGLARSHESFR